MRKSIDLTEAKLAKALELAPKLTLGADMFSGISEGNNLSKLAEVLPFPVNLRNRLKSPGSLLSFDIEPVDLKGLVCPQGEEESDLPPGLLAKLEPICDAGANEKLAPAIADIERIVTNIKTSLGGGLGSGGSSDPVCKACDTSFVSCIEDAKKADSDLGKVVSVCEKRVCDNAFNACRCDCGDNLFCTGLPLLCK